MIIPTTATASARCGGEEVELDARHIGRHASDQEVRARPHQGACSPEDRREAERDKKLRDRLSMRLRPPFDLRDEHGNHGRVVQKPRGGEYREAKPRESPARTSILAERALHEPAQAAVTREPLRDDEQERDGGHPHIGEAAERGLGRHRAREHQDTERREQHVLGGVLASKQEHDHGPQHRQANPALYRQRSQHYYRPGHFLHKAHRSKAPESKFLLNI